jgi:hypothetical protein
VASTSLQPELLEEWTARLDAARRHRELAQQEAKAADDSFRDTIKSASNAGLSAPQIAAPVQLSTFRVYQICNGRRT